MTRWGSCEKVLFPGTFLGGGRGALRRKKHVYSLLQRKDRCIQSEILILLYRC